MWVASPITTASVTERSGCSDVPDFSAYFSAYFHILSTFAWDGVGFTTRHLRSAGEGVDRFVDLVRVEARELPVADEQHRQRCQPDLHQLLSRLRIPSD